MTWTGCGKATDLRQQVGSTDSFVIVFGWLSKSRSHFSAPEFWDPIAESSRTIWGLPVNGAIISSTTIRYAAKMATLELEFCERDDIVQSLCVSYHAGLVQEKLCCCVS